MEHIHITPQSSRSSKSARPSHSTVREGVRLGLIVGVATWLWVAALDLVVGEPLMTAQSLGGATAFTVVHFLLCVAYGLTIMSAIHASMKEPTVIIALIFCTILFQAAFVVVTAILANVGAGQLVWSKFFAGNVMAAILTYMLVDRNHPLSDLYHAAEAHQKD